MGKVKCSLSLDARVMPSMCDETSRMSVPAMLDMFQDMAGVHAGSVGMGAFDLEDKGLFWIVSKTRIRINSRPLVMSMLEAVTWIQPAERVSCERDWAIYEDGEQVAYVRSMWAALRREDFRPARLTEVYPDADYTMDPPDDTPFRRMSRKFEGAETLGEYRIRSVDIDRGGHMNNVNYVRAMLGCFSCAEITGMEIRELDMQFLQQCYEGDTIRFVKRTSEDGIMEVGALNEKGETCFVAAVQ